MKKVSLLWVIGCVTQLVAADDSSQYLGNKSRTGSVDFSVPAQPALLWDYKEKHAPKHAWKDPSREVQFIDFDYASQVAISEGLAIFGSSADHTVRALDMKTGEQRWILRMEAPIRTVPEVGDGCIYIAGDDGFVRCLKTQTGEEIWQLRVGPKNTRCIGNDQLISRWPSRSGALLDGDKLYCTGGMWSHDGVTIYCLDAKTGKEIWTNDTCSYHLTEMPHGEGYAGVSPQGNLVLYKDILYVPTGRSEPAFFDANTGEFLYFATGVGYKAQYPGGSWVMGAHDRVWFKRRTNHTGEEEAKEPGFIRDPGPSSSSGIIGWNYKTGEPEMALTDKNLAAFKDDVVIMAGYGPIIRTSYKEMTDKYKDFYNGKKNVALDLNVKAPVRYGKEYQYAADFTHQPGKKEIPDLTRAVPMFMSPVPFTKWEADLGRIYALMITNNKVLVGSREAVSLLDLASGKVLWTYDVDGEARNIVVTEGQFIVSTTTGHVYCFGADAAAKGQLIQTPTERPVLASAAVREAKQIIKETGVQAGYCFLLGAGANPDLMIALIEESDLNVYGLEPDAGRAATLRERLDAAGYLGVRGQVYVDSMQPLPFNPYIADLVVFGTSMGSGPNQVSADEIYRITRPCGGIAYGLTDAAGKQPVEQWLLSAVSEAELKTAAGGVMVRREPIPGSGDWSHPQGNVGRTGSSDDDVAKIPMSLLWWGGPGSARGLARHEYPPVPLYCNGRMYIQGENDVYAVNAYNGRELWNRYFKNVARWPQYGRGGNIVADEACVYVVHHDACYALDGATGETVREYVLKNPEQYKVVEWTQKTLGKGEDRTVPEWDFLAVTEKHVIGTLCATYANKPSVGKILANPYEARVVFVFDKESGKLLWTKELDNVAAATALVSDGKSLFLLDRTNEGKFLFARKKGQLSTITSTLRAFDLKTGKENWTTPNVNPLGKELIYKDGVLVAGPPRGSMDTSWKAAVVAFDARTGAKMWEQDDLTVYIGGGRNVSRQVTFIIDNSLYVAPHVFNLQTGEELTPLKDPITGEAEGYSIRGQNFCGGVSAGKHLTAYRSTAVGLQEIGKNSGSFWLPEVRSSCEISLLPAGGLVLAPEGSSTCVCSFSYKTSLALFPAPEPKLEDWSLHFAENTYETIKFRAKGKKTQNVKPQLVVGRVEHLRLNMNAPGDRTDEADATWFGYPRDWMEGTKFIPIDLPVKTTGIQAEYHLNADHHAVKNTNHPWLYTSGVYGPVELVVDTKSDDKYTVILHFAEMGQPATGPRQFDALVGDTLVENINLSTGGAPLIKTVKGVQPNDHKVQIKLLPKKGSQPVLCAIEILCER